MKLIGSLIKKNIRQYSMLIGLVVILVIFQITTNGVLLIPMNVTSLIIQNAYVFILGIGMMLLLINGGNVDLAVGSVVAFTGAILGMLISKNQINTWLSIVLVLAIGLIIGIWQGFWIAYIRVPGFVATLSGQLIFRGLTLKILNGTTISPFPSEFQKITNGFLPNIVVSGIDALSLLIAFLITVTFLIFQLKKRFASTKDNKGAAGLPTPLYATKLILISAVILLAGFWFARYKGISVLFITLGALVLLFSFITSKTVPGRYIYAMGGNEKAAKYSGINTNLILFLCYVNMGLLAAIAGVVYTSRLNAAAPSAGVGFELDAISACFVGGASMYGGVGTIPGVIIGALFMGVLNNGMSILGVGTDVQQCVKGLVLLSAVALDIFYKSKANITVN
jgi:putative multiple sugar transport system permease protein